jgi:hypothetical protein
MYDLFSLFSTLYQCFDAKAATLDHVLDLIVDTWRSWMVARGRHERDIT